MSYQVTTYQMPKGIAHIPITKDFLMLDVPDGAKVFYLKLHAVANNFFGGKRQHHFNGVSQEAVAERIDMKPPAFRKALRGLEAAGLARYSRNGVTLLPPEGVTLEQPTAKKEEEEEEQQPAIEVITPEVVTAAIDRKRAPAPIKRNPAELSDGAECLEIWNNGNGAKLKGNIPGNVWACITTWAKSFEVPVTMVMHALVLLAANGYERDGKVIPQSIDFLTVGIGSTDSEPINRVSVFNVIQGFSEYEEMEQKKARELYAQHIEPVEDLFDLFHTTFLETLPDEVKGKGLALPDLSEDDRSRLIGPWKDSKSYGLNITRAPLSKHTYSLRDSRTYKAAGELMRHVLKEMCAPKEVTRETVIETARRAAMALPQSPAYQWFRQQEPVLAPWGGNGPVEEATRIYWKTPNTPPELYGLVNMNMGEQTDLERAHEDVHQFAAGLWYVMNNEVGRADKVE